MLLLGLQRLLRDFEEIIITMASWSDGSVGSDEA